MKITELGERGLIDLLAKTIESSRDDKVESWRQLVIGIGDDAAAWHCDNSIQLATVDSLVQDVHFTLEKASWTDLGWKALAVSLSDIAAMGGSPRYALVSLGLPPQTDVEDVLSFYRGMLALAKQHGVAIVGGDTDSVPLVTIMVTVLGTADHKPLLTRSAAKPGDLVAVTGCLGGASAGLHMLKQGLKFDNKTTASLRQAFSRPVPRVAEGQLLVAQGARAAIDISDGLVADLTHICKASRVGARVNVDAVPVSPAARIAFGEQSLELALSGGEDYELLFTASVEVMDKIKLAACPVTVIGEITGQTGEISLVDGRGKPFKLGKAGWEHFTR